MKNLNHYKLIVEAEKTVDYEKLEKLTVTNPDGSKTVHKASNSGKTVEEVAAEDSEETDKTKIEIDKSKKKDKTEKTEDSEESKDNDKKKEDQ